MTPQRPRIAGLLLAAGSGTRFGGPKALADSGDGPWVTRALATLGSVDLRAVVIGAAADEVAALLPEGVRVVRNAEHDSGMGSSLVAGLRALFCAGAGSAGPSAVELADSGCGGAIGGGGAGSAGPSAVDLADSGCPGAIGGGGAGPSAVDLAGSGCPGAMSTESAGPSAVELADSGCGGAVGGGSAGSAGPSAVDLADSGCPGAIGGGSPGSAGPSAADLPDSDCRGAIDAVVVMLVDLPDVPAAAIRRVIDTVTHDVIDTVTGPGSAPSSSAGRPVEPARPGAGAGAAVGGRFGEGNVINNEPDPLRQATRAALARACYHGEPGHPVLIGADHIAGVIAAATGDRGARDYLAGHATRLIECGDLASGRDRDTPIRDRDTPIG